jgi:hypothetical protein
MSLEETIKLMLINEHSHLSLDDLLREIFNKYNISFNNIKEIIQTLNKKNKCNKCRYKLNYSSIYKQYILKCELCNNINTCDCCIENYEYYDNNHGIIENLICDLCNTIIM